MYKSGTIATVLVVLMFLTGCSPQGGGDKANLAVRVTPSRAWNLRLSGEQLPNAPVLGERAFNNAAGSETHTFRGIPPGTYLLELEPDMESYSNHCMAYRRVTLHSGDNRIEMQAPTDKLKVTVVFPAPEPQFPLFGAIPLRVEHLGPGGVDPVYRQWLFVSKTPPHVGSLGYLECGTYRITSFSTGEGYSYEHHVDLYRADIQVDAAALKTGTMEIQLQPIKAAGS